VHLSCGIALKIDKSGAERQKTSKKARNSKNGLEFGVFQKTQFFTNSHQPHPLRPTQLFEVVRCKLNSHFRDFQPIAEGVIKGLHRSDRLSGSLTHSHNHSRTLTLFLTLLVIHSLHAHSLTRERWFSLAAEILRFSCIFRSFSDQWRLDKRQIWWVHLSFGDIHRERRFVKWFQSDFQTLVFGRNYKAVGVVVYLGLWFKSWPHVREALSDWIIIKDWILKRFVPQKKKLFWSLVGLKRK